MWVNYHTIFKRWFQLDDVITSDVIDQNPYFTSKLRHFSMTT